MFPCTMFCTWKIGCFWEWLFDWLYSRESTTSWFYTRCLYQWMPIFDNLLIYHWMWDQRRKWYQIQRQTIQFFFKFGGTKSRPKICGCLFAFPWIIFIYAEIVEFWISNSSNKYLVNLFNDCIFLGITRGCWLSFNAILILSKIILKPLI